MASARFILALVAVVAFAHGAAAALTLAAWNIETLGPTKMSKPHIVGYLVEILARYDMTVIQEIRNADGTAIVQLLDELNAYSTEQYDMVISERLGRSSNYMEQYALFYKIDLMTPTATYQYPDPGDLFEREPYVALFNAPTTAIGSFAVAATHVKPDDAVSEIDLLTDVYDAAAAALGTDNIAIMGDYNAGCSYVSESDWPNIRLRTQTRFVWHISDDADTNTTPNTACPYDRIVSCGSSLPGQLSGAGVFKFDDYYGLTYEAADEISDHYPVYVDIA